MMTETEAIQLAAPQIKQAAEVLARAFYEDPMMMFIFPDDARRARLLPWYMGVWIRYGRMYGEVTTTEGKVEGAAVWFPPETFQVTPLRIIRAGIIVMPLRLGPAAFGRFMRIANCLEELQKRDVPPRHLYLLSLGVDPLRQGHGVGTALLQPVLACADAESCPCYLETTKDRNVRFYEKHGFEVASEGDLPRGGPHFWTMKREPQG